MSVEAYSLWETGRDRYAVTLGNQVLPILGYVALHADRSWRIERSGRNIKISYSSAAHAAKALVAMVEEQTTGGD